MLLLVYFLMLLHYCYCIVHKDSQQGIVEIKAVPLRSAPDVRGSIAGFMNCLHNKASSVTLTPGGCQGTSPSRSYTAIAVAGRINLVFRVAALRHNKDELPRGKHRI